MRLQGEFDIDHSWEWKGLSLPSSKSTFSQPFKDKCMNEVVINGCIIISHLINLWKAKFLHTVWCYISGEGVGEIWSWSLLGCVPRYRSTSSCRTRSAGTTSAPPSSWTSSCPSASTCITSGERRAALGPTLPRYVHDVTLFSGRCRCGIRRRVGLELFITKDSGRYHGNTLFYRTVTSILSQWLLHEVTNSRPVFMGESSLENQQNDVVGYH